MLLLLARENTTPHVQSRCKTIGDIAEQWSQILNKNKAKQRHRKYTRKDILKTAFGCGFKSEDKKYTELHDGITILDNFNSRRKKSTKKNSIDKIHISQDVEQSLLEIVRFIN